MHACDSDPNTRTPTQTADDLQAIIARNAREVMLPYTPPSFQRNSMVDRRGLQQEDAQRLRDSVAAEPEDGDGGGAAEEEEQDQDHEGVGPEQHDAGAAAEAAAAAALNAGLASANTTAEAPDSQATVNSTVTLPLAICADGEQHS
jgi:hypothetical protein